MENRSAELLWQFVIRLHRSYMCGERPVGGKEKVVSRLKEEVEELEDDLKRQTQMNGISLNSCTTKTLQRSKRTALFTSFLLMEFLKTSYGVMFCWGCAFVSCTSLSAAHFMFCWFHGEQQVVVVSCQKMWQCPTKNWGEEDFWHVNSRRQW